MKRALALAAVVVAAIATLASLGAGGSGDGYRVDALLDNAGFLVPGQDVKIAGAKVGTVKDVTLTADRHARVQMDIDPGFAPFRADADCTVQPQSLIGERFIQCTPGTSAAPPLARAGGTPTVPITQTHSPVDLDLVLTAFRAPAPQRLGLLLSSLGAGLAGRGDDLDAIIRRANPALQQSARVLQVVNANRRDLRDLIAGAHEVVGELDRRRDDVARFVRSSAGLTTTAAERRAQLRSAVRDLPGLLRRLNPYLDTVVDVTNAGTPTLTSLSRAATPAQRLLGRVDTLSGRVRPAARELAGTARQARALVPVAKPVLTRLDRLTASALPAARLVNALGDSSKQQGAIDGLLRFFYYGTAATARYDNVSHLLGAYPVVSTCSLYATTPTPGCDSHFDSFKGQPAATRRAPRTPARKGGAGTPAGVTPAAVAPATPVPATPAPAAPAGPGAILPSVVDGVQSILDYLLK